MSNDALKRAVAIAGGQASFGAIFGKSQQLVSHWVRTQLPAEHVLKVESETGVPRWELRPDIYPPHLEAGPEAPAKAA